MNNTILRENSVSEIEKQIKESKELGKSINFMAKFILVITWGMLFYLFYVITENFPNLNQNSMKALIIGFLISLLGTIPGYLITQAIGHSILLKAYMLDQLKK